MRILVKFAHTLCRNSNNSFHTRNSKGEMQECNVYWLTNSMHKQRGNFHRLTSALTIRLWPIT